MMAFDPKRREFFDDKLPSESVGEIILQNAVEANGQKIDLLITKLLEDYLGEPIIHLDKILKRCTLGTFPDGRSIFAIDGVELVELYFPEIVHGEDEKNQMTITVKQRYRIVHKTDKTV